MLSKSEIGQFDAVKIFVGNSNKRYDFWLTYENQQAIGFEGGTELQLTTRFRNDFSLLPDGTIRVNYFEG